MDIKDAPILKNDLGNSLNCKNEVYRSNQESLKRAYENSCVDSYYCKMCDVHTTGPESIEAHLAGKRHYKKLKSLKEGGVLNPVDKKPCPALSTTYQTSELGKNIDPQPQECWQIKVINKYTSSGPKSYKSCPVTSESSQYKRRRVIAQSSPIIPVGNVIKDVNKSIVLSDATSNDIDEGEVRLYKEFLEFRKYKRSQRGGTYANI